MATAHRKLMDSGAVALQIATTATWNTATADTTTYNVTLPSGIQSGNLLLMFISVDSANDELTRTGWTTLANDGSANSERKYILARIADGTEGATASFTNATAQTASANTYRITGARNGLTSSEIAVSAIVNQTSNVASADPPSLTPSWGSAENLWFAVAFINDSAIGSVTAYPTNYSLGQLSNINGSSASGQAVLTAARLLSASTEDPSAFTWTTGRRSSAYTVAVRPQ